MVLIGCNSTATRAIQQSYSTPPTSKTIPPQNVFQILFLDSSHQITNRVLALPLPSLFLMLVKDLDICCWTCHNMHLCLYNIQPTHIDMLHYSQQFHPCEYMVGTYDMCCSHGNSTSLNLSNTWQTHRCRPLRRAWCLLC